MPRRKTPHLTQLELEIMDAIWDTDDATVESIRAHLDAGGRELALPSIRTMLGILTEKGYADRRSEGRKHIYFALVPREEARTRMLGDLTEKLFAGSPLDLVSTLINNKMVDRDDLKKVKAMISQAERKQRK